MLFASSFGPNVKKQVFLRSWWWEEEESDEMRDFSVTNLMSLDKFIPKFTEETKSLPHRSCILADVT